MLRIKQIFGIIFILCLFFICSSCEKYPLDPLEGFEDLFGVYFGESIPDSVPQRFCPSFFSEELHSPPIFSPDGREVYFKPMSTSGYSKIFEMRMEDNKWTKAFHASFNFNAINDAPFITPDGERLYFLSAKNESVTDFKENIYFVSRSGNDWSGPTKISSNVNDHSLHWQFSVSENYTLYFQDAADNDLYYSAYANGEYQEAVKLPEMINSPILAEACPFIASDESYLIFNRREGVYSNLYISFKDFAGEWQEALNITAVNTNANELYAYVTPDKKYLFFLRMTNEGSFPYWVDTSVLDQLKPII